MTTGSEARARARCNTPGAEGPSATKPCGTDPDGSRSFTKDNSFYFKRVLDLRNVMEQNGEGGKKVWLTEFGWTSTPADQVVKGYEYSQFNSEDQ